MTNLTKFKDPGIQDCWAAMRPSLRTTILKFRDKLHGYGSDITLEELMRIWVRQCHIGVPTARCALCDVEFEDRGPLSPRLWRLNPAGGWDPENCIFIVRLLYDNIRGYRVSLRDGVPIVQDRLSRVLQGLQEREHEDPGVVAPPTPACAEMDGEEPENPWSTSRLVRDWKLVEAGIDPMKE